MCTFSKKVHISYLTDCQNAQHIAIILYRQKFGNYINKVAIRSNGLPLCLWCGQQDSNLHALAGEPKSPESTNSTMPAYSFVPLIFTRGGTRGGAFRLTHIL